VNFNKKKTNNQQLLDEVKQLKIDLEKPVNERKEKLDFVRKLKLKITQTDKPVLIGQKGMGKTTFLWLLNECAQPIQTDNDGTISTNYLQKFIDTIGVQWTFECMLKLCAIFVLNGFPNDIILFTNNRYVQALDCLTLCMITQPMIVILDCNYLYTKIEEDKFEYNDTGGYKHVNDKTLGKMYNQKMYQSLEQTQKVRSITHHNCANIINLRRNSNINPFKILIDELNKNFFIHILPDDASNINELLFRYIYIYETKYKY